jgi:hypothetical protein
MAVRSVVFPPSWDKVVLVARSLLGLCVVLVLSAVAVVVLNATAPPDDTGLFRDLDPAGVRRLPVPASTVPTTVDLLAPGGFLPVRALRDVGPGPLNGSAACLGALDDVRLPATDLGGSDVGLGPGGVLMINGTQCVPAGVCNLLYGAGAWLAPRPAHDAAAALGPNCPATGAVVACEALARPGWATPDCWTVAALAAAGALVVLPGAAGACGAAATASEPAALPVALMAHPTTDGELRLRFDGLVAEADLATGVRVALAVSFAFRPDRAPQLAYLEAVDVRATADNVTYRVCQPPHLALDHRVRRPQAWLFAVPLSVWRAGGAAPPWDITLTLRASGLQANESVALASAAAVPCGIACPHACFALDDAALPPLVVGRVDACDEPHPHHPHCERLVAAATVTPQGGVARTDVGGHCFQLVRFTVSAGGDAAALGGGHGYGLNATGAHALGIGLSLHAVDGAGSGYADAHVVAVDGFALPDAVAVGALGVLYVTDLPAGYTSPDPAVDADTPWLRWVTLVVRTLCAGSLSASAAGELTVIRHAPCRHAPQPLVSLGHAVYPDWAPPTLPGLGFKDAVDGAVLDVNTLHFLSLAGPAFLPPSATRLRVHWTGGARPPRSNASLPAQATLLWLGPDRNHSLVDHLRGGVGAFHVSAQQATNQLCAAHGTRCLLGLRVLRGQIKLVDIRVEFCADCEPLDDARGPDVVVFAHSHAVTLPAITWPAQPAAHQQAPDQCGYGYTQTRTFALSPSSGAAGAGSDWAAPARLVPLGWGQSLSPADGCPDAFAAVGTPTVAVATELLDILGGNVTTWDDGPLEVQAACQFSSYVHNVPRDRADDATTTPMLVRTATVDPAAVAPNRPLTSLVDHVLEPVVNAFEFEPNEAAWPLIGSGAVTGAAYAKYVGNERIAGEYTSLRADAKYDQTQGSRQLAWPLVPPFLLANATFDAAPGYCCDGWDYSVKPNEDGWPVRQQTYPNSFCLWQPTNLPPGSSAWFATVGDASPAGVVLAWPPPVVPVCTALVLAPSVGRRDVLEACNVTATDETLQLSGALASWFHQYKRALAALYPLGHGADRVAAELHAIGGQHQDHPGGAPAYVERDYQRAARANDVVFCAELPPAAPV